MEEYSAAGGNLRNTFSSNLALKELYWRNFSTILFSMVHRASVLQPEKARSEFYLLELGRFQQSVDGAVLKHKTNVRPQFNRQSPGNVESHF